MAGEKRREISILNVCFCLAVVGIHLLSEPVVRLSPGPWLKTVKTVQGLLFFAVYGFFFLSGLKLFLSPRPLGEFYRRRLTAVVLPYAVCVTVYVLFCAVTGYDRVTLTDLPRYYLLGTIAPHLYFVPALVQMYLLMPLWQALFRRFDGRILAAAGMAVTLLAGPVARMLWMRLFARQPAYLDRCFLPYLGFWLMGCAAGRDPASFRRFLDRYRAILIAAAAVLGAVSRLTPRWTDNWELIVAGRTLWYAAAVPAACALAGPVRELGIWRSRLFGLLDRGSYEIYLYHILFLMVAGMVMPPLGIRRLIPRFLVRAVFALAGPLLIRAVREALLRRKKIEKNGR